MWTYCGLRIAALWLADRLLRGKLPIHILAIRVHDAEALAQTPLPDTGGYSLKVANRDDLLAASTDDTIGLSRDFIDAALAKGDVCVGAYDSNRIVSYGWCSRVPTRAFDDLDIEVGADYVYGYRAQTSLQHRGKGLHTAVILFAGKAVAVPEGKGMIAFIDMGNDRSLISEARVGNLNLGVAVLWITRRKVRMWATPLCHRVGLKFSRNALRAG